MNLEQGIQKAVDQFGKEVIKKKALVSILDDYHAFSIRAHRNVIISLLENGYGEKIYKLDEDNPPDKLLKLKSYAMEAISDDGLGLKENYVYYIIECICYAIGWNDESSPKKSSSKKNTNVCIETSQSHISPSKRALHRVGDCVATIKSSQNRIPVQSKTSAQIKNVNISPNQKNPNLISKNKTSKDIFQFIAIIIMFSILVLIGY